MKNRLIPIFLVITLLVNFHSVFAQHETEYPVYIIREGDSLGSIATLFDTSITELLKINNINNPDLISPGQIINIPGYTGISGTFEIVTPQLGESLFSLSIKYGTNVDQIIQLNHLLSPTSVYPGSTLIVAVRPNNSLLLPVSITRQNETGIESAARSFKNLSTLSLLNQIQNANLCFVDQIIFSVNSENSRAINLFAPLLEEVSLDPLPMVQGSTEVVSVSSQSPLLLQGSIGDHELIFNSESPNHYYALQGIHALAEPGLVDFNLNVTLADGTEHSYRQMVLLQPGFFDQDPPLLVDPKTLDPTITEPENELVFSLVSQKTPFKYWSGIFSSPAVYQEYNSLFGTRRWYNDDPEVRFHGGVDFAGGMTLPVSAPAPGLIVFAGPLTVRGNAVFIDHGWGVFSGFFHQDTLKVKLGDRVNTGDVIGTVGNTGRVNGAGDYLGAGAHLHWELWVNEVQVDPLEWLSREYP